MTRATTMLILLASLAGCASTKPTKARRELAQTVQARTGIDDPISSEQDKAALARVTARVDDLLAGPLTLDDALRVALLNNRGFQAQLEDLGVAQAELVQAGLLENPSIGGDLMISTRGNGLGGGLALSQSLLSAFLIPAKRRLAKAHLRHAIVEVGQTTLALVRDVRVAFFTAQAAQAHRDLEQKILQAAQVADELAVKQAQAGNLNELERARVASALDQARLHALDADLELVEAREQLTRLLGLWGEGAQWKIAEPLAELPAHEAGVDALEQHGVGQRLDLSAARFEVQAMEYALKLRRRAVVPQVDVGVESRNEVADDPGHEWVLGPSLSIELPIFDPGNADFARLRAELRRARHNLQHASVIARSEIRLHRERMVAARRRVEYYRGTVLPRQQTIVDESLAQYNGMLMGAYELFETRVQQLQAEQAHVEVLRDYWATRADLELAIGGRLPEARAFGTEEKP